jgi:hypothetical protein
LGNASKILFSKSQRERPISRCKYKYYDNIKIDLKGITCEDGWMDGTD